eukprot:scaffold15776_cov75-Phaeocystis_antarctica.AAC.1
MTEQVLRRNRSCVLPPLWAAAGGPILGPVLVRDANRLHMLQSSARWFVRDHRWRCTPESLACLARGTTASPCR